MSLSFPVKPMGGHKVAYVDPQFPSVDSAFVFIHGMWSGSKAFEHQLKRCQFLGIKAYAVLRTTGKLTTFDDYVKEVGDVVKAIGAETPVILIGHSLGGLIVQKLCEQKFDFVHGAVYMESALPSDLVHLPLFWFLLDNIQAAAFGKQFVPSRRFAMKNILNGLAESEKEQAYAEFIRESGRVLRDVAKGIEVEATGCPTLVIAGDNDKLFPPESQMKLVRKYHASYDHLPFGHMMPVEDVNGRVIGRILRWMNFAVPSRAAEIPVGV